MAHFNRNMYVLPYTYKIEIEYVTVTYIVKILQTHCHCFREKIGKRSR